MELHVFYLELSAKEATPKSADSYTWLKKMPLPVWIHAE